jgi:tRNA nucleotidyltransferase (CCA-adding enzyme)
MPYLPEAKTEALKALPGAQSLLAAVAERPGTYLVGGAVRDLMLGFAQFDFDLVVEGEAAELADHLAAEIGGAVRKHERFGTATFSGDNGLSVDIATARVETYAAPGALPDVSPADLEHDLVRRDFTVNAMALAIWHARLGELFEFPDATADLAARLLRVTHDQSFIDDPTRLLRLLRYGARLGFTAEPHTEELARSAVEAGAIGTVSGRRIADELLDLLAERSAVVALDSMYALGLDRAMHPQFDADEYLASRATLQMADGIRQDLLLLAVCSRAMDAAMLEQWLEFLNLPQHDRAVVTDAVMRHGEVAQLGQAAAADSEFDATMRSYKPETVALAAAMPGSPPEFAERAHSWLADRNGERLAITGADLRAAGAPEGPAIGRALAAALDRAIDGELQGKADQLEFALRVVREDGSAFSPDVE